MRFLHAVIDIGRIYILTRASVGPRYYIRVRLPIGLEVGGGGNTTPGPFVISITIVEAIMIQGLYFVFF